MMVVLPLFDFHPVEEVFLDSLTVSVSAQDDIVAHGKVHMRLSPSHKVSSRLPLKQCQVIFWLNTDRS